MKKSILKDKLKMIKAAILSGTIAVTASGCGSIEDDEFEKDLGANPAIVSEIEEEISSIAEKTTNEEESTAQTTEEQPTNEEPTTKKEDPTTKATEAPTNEKTTEQKTTTAQTTTENEYATIPDIPKDNTDKDYKRESTGISSNTQVSNKITTTTQTTTTTTTTKATTTTIPYELRTYTKKDMKSSDDYEAYISFTDLCGSFDKEMFSNYVHRNQYGETMYEISPAILAILNYDQGLNPRMLAYESVLGANTEKEFIQLCDNLNFADYQVFYKTKVDFKDYVINEKFAELLNRVCAEYKEYKNGNTEPLETEMNNYFNSKPNNYVEYYFMANTRAMMNAKSGNYRKTLDSEAQQLYFENVVQPFYEDFIQYKGKCFTK